MISQVRPPGPDRCPVYRDRPLSDPPKNPGPGWCHLLDPPKKPGPGWCHLLDPPKKTGPGWCHLCPTGRPAPGTGTGGGDRFLQSVTMTQSEAEEDGCDGESGHEEQSEECHDEVEVVKGSGSRTSTTPILRLPERNEEDTCWTRSDVTKPDSAKNKLTVEDMTRVCKRKDLLWKEVTKNEQASLVDRWLRDQVKPERWDHIATVFPQRDKYLPQHKWMLMSEDTKSPIPIRYQQYGITVK
jgi:hypothetical protein